MYQKILLQFAWHREVLENDKWLLLSLPFNSYLILNLSLKLIFKMLSSSKSSVNILTIYTGTRFSIILKCVFAIRMPWSKCWIAAIYRSLMPLGSGFPPKTGGFSLEFFVANPCVCWQTEMAQFSFQTRNAPKQIDDRPKVERGGVLLETILNWGNAHTNVFLFGH